MWICPNCHEIEQGIVCGGDEPYYNHGEQEKTFTGNIYFMMELSSGKLLEIPWTSVDFELTQEDWQAMHLHAFGGCATEPQCPECFEYLDQ